MFQVKPYVLPGASKDFLATNPSATSSFESGMDVRYGLTPNMTLDLSYNTDFAQAEVDKQQVNLDRFNLFFPEKRSFFLENAGQFSIGSPGAVDLFFSRRIGISGNGSVVPIIGGSRLSGKIGQTNVGFLSMFTDDVVKDSIDKNNYTVTRINHNFSKSRSSIGGAYISRSGLGDNSHDYIMIIAVAIAVSCV
mgnify:CR=1 FL=1